MTNSHLFVTGADIGLLQADILDSELGAYDFLKLIYHSRFREIDDLFRELSHGFDLYCQGRMAPTMTKWVKHRRQYPDLDLAVSAWRH